MELWREFPDRYERCSRCSGSGTIDCPWCSGRGSTVGPDRYLIGGRLGRRFGLKVCTTCRGSGKLSCGLCTAGSMRKIS
jgi:DnaJ-class molecular chaperone